MLNYETILSSYDDKMTLMQWLKKVEEALKSGSATAFKVNKKGEATLTFEIDFEDGTKLESGEIVLQQGETGPQGVGVVSFSIDANNHLIVTFTNGTTQDLGNLFSGNIEISGNLNVSGAITGISIIETMVGYGFTPNGNNVANDIELNYVGVVKNGNKLTMAVAGVLTPNEDMESNPTIGFFTLPQAVLSKLFPNSLGVLDNKVVSFFSSVSMLPIDRAIVMWPSTSIQMYQVKNVLTAGTPYSFRYEVTFLLSDNLIGN